MVLRVVCEPLPRGVLRDVPVRVVGIILPRCEPVPVGRVGRKCRIANSRRATPQCGRVAAPRHEVPVAVTVVSELLLPRRRGRLLLLRRRQTVESVVGHRLHEIRRPRHLDRHYDKVSISPIGYMGQCRAL